MLIALSFYTVTGIIYSELRLAIILFSGPAGRSSVNRPTEQKRRSLHSCKDVIK
ncbi:hypothetical protein GH769_04345 [Pseudomonas sp. CFSAN084952]|nr:hypothetical protein GH769_04345 [Pseudomonas sp. CFSAN084952]